MNRSEQQISRWYEVRGLMNEIIQRVMNSKAQNKGLCSSTGGQKVNAPYQITFPIEPTHIARATIKLNPSDAWMLLSLEHDYKSEKDINPDSFDVDYRSGMNFKALSLRNKHLVLTLEVKL